MSSMNDVLMQMLAGGRAPGMSAANIPEMLATLAARNPQMAPIVQQLQERFAQQSAGPAEVPMEEPEIMEPARTSRRQEELKRVAKRMFVELQAWRARSEMLAEALGACHLCWGEDEGCSYCSGEGCIGTYVIKAQVFEDVVGPAMQQVRQRPPLAKTQSTTKGERSHAI